MANPIIHHTPSEPCSLCIRLKRSKAWSAVGHQTNPLGNAPRSVQSTRKHSKTPTPIRTPSTSSLTSLTSGLLSQDQTTLCKRDGPTRWICTSDGKTKDCLLPCISTLLGHRFSPSACLQLASHMTTERSVIQPSSFSLLHLSSPASPARHDRKSHRVLAPSQIRSPPSTTTGPTGPPAHRPTSPHSPPLFSPLLGPPYLKHELSKDACISRLLPCDAKSNDRESWIIVIATFHANHGQE